MKATRMTDYRDIIPNRAAGYTWLGEDVEQTPAIITGFHGNKNVLQNAIYISPSGSGRRDNRVQRERPC